MDPDNFLANIVMLMAQELVDRDGTWHRRTSQQHNGDLSYDDKVLFVPTMYLVGDMLHAEASDPVLDYSTVGVRVLAAWANILVDQSPSLSSKLAALKECAKGRINTIEEWPGGRGLPEGSLRWMLLVRWALDVALIAARRRHPEYTSKVVDTMSRDQLFFRRFCQTTCGDARAAALCDYGTRNSVLFANAFGCQEALPLAC
ncbi:uncharacterized protein LOC125758042 [Rhipicephalus sanguineus]|uniref:uncharacterized protein LOC125758042 n=1 Tax=Rhipicephalus sanguineus TaxID=34632 RepID=UPI0020C429E4|nr:uncharacterized protein LOC125758042 [Rhipicephalus sanguineus]